MRQLLDLLILTSVLVWLYERIASWVRNIRHRVTQQEVEEMHDRLEAELNVYKAHNKIFRILLDKLEALIKKLDQ